ncbi:MAG: pyruvate dehydrogenase (acetyl-transferring) E1 component subunit alpha [Anaerolineales bacterium]|nr:pyruvate dehydrogenase (acetyl-transferring) E1 component subunit alpha [Anaerolineales bacterium]
MDKKNLFDLYYEMVLVRRLEEASARLYQQGKIGGFLHLYIGQEAVGSGIVAARKPHDRVITAYRDHGVAISCGMDPKVIMAELLGKETGCSKGRGGSMHLADVELNFWGGHAIVGAHLPLASGMAMADKYRNADAVTICMFGDGATNIGYFHEALNLSMVWELPVLWVCENNQYGMGTAVDRASAVSEIRQKAEGFGMPNSRVDGMDIIQVYEATKAALEKVRTGGPYFLEAVTYRFRGHSMGDPERYRESEEIEKWQKDDPIGIFRQRLIESEGISTDELDVQEGKAEAAIEEAIQFADSSPDPDPATLYDYVYVE